MRCLCADIALRKTEQVLRLVKINKRGSQPPYTTNPLASQSFSTHEVFRVTNSLNLCVLTRRASVAYTILATHLKPYVYKRERSLSRHFSLLL